MSNILIGWSNLTDSVGRKVSEYTLALNKGSIVDWMPKLYAFGVDIIWNVFMFMVTLAGTALSWIGNPSWLNGLDNTYKSLTDSMFSVVNPVVLSVGGFVILMLYISIDGVKSTSARLEKSDINRIVAAICMMIGIAFLALNPFMLLKMALSAVQVGVASIAGTDTKSLDVFSVDAMIRQPTLIITYNGAVNEKCADLWSKTGGLEDNGACFDPGQNTPSAVTLVLAVLAWLMALAALVFAAWSAWKFFRHLTVAVLGFVSLPWVAAVSLFRRRQFDQLGAVAAVACGNMIMVFIVQIIALGGPTLVSKVMSDWGQSGSAVLQMIALIFTYLVLTGILVSATGKHSAVVNSLKADASTALRTYLGSPGAGMNLSNSSSLRQQFRDIRNSNWKKYASNAVSVGRFVKGKAANIFNKESEAMESLQDVQSTVNLSDPVKSGAQWVPTGAGSTTADRVAKNMAFGSGADAVLSLTPGTGGSPSQSPFPSRPGAPSPNRGGIVVQKLKAAMSATLPPEMDKAVSLTASKIPPMDMAQLVSGVSKELSAISGSGMDGVKTELSDANKNLTNLSQVVADSLKDLGITSAEDMAKLYKAIIAQNMTMHDGLFGGRTPPDVVQQVVHDTVVSTVKNVVINNAPTAAATYAVDSSGKISVTDRMAEFKRNSVAHARGSASSIVSTDAGDVDSAREVQSTAQATRREIARQSALVRYHGSTAGSHSPNSLLGGAATRGDVSITRTSLPSVCDKADDEAHIEALIYKRRSRGEGGYPVYPEDRAHDIRFSPDRPEHIISPYVGVGFGDDIY